MIFGRAVDEDVEEEAPDEPSGAGDIEGHRPSPVQSRLSSDHHHSSIIIMVIMPDSPDTATRRGGR